MSMTREEEIRQAYETLHQYVLCLAEAAHMSVNEGEAIWGRISASDGVIRELAYYHDYGEFLCEYQVAGYTLADILVWQVDHFKAYMDRHEEMNRYRRERLLLTAFDILCKMEQDPDSFVEKMQGESGTDFVDKY